MAVKQFVKSDYRRDPSTDLDQSQFSFYEDGEQPEGWVLTTEYTWKRPMAEPAVEQATRQIGQRPQARNIRGR